jgi:hypothetical protein
VEVEAEQEVVGPGHSDRRRYTAVALVGIWVAVAVASAFSPDLVTGSEHDHLALVAATAWFWGAISSGLVLLASAVGGRTEEGASLTWRIFGIETAAVWVAAAVVGVFGPTLVTGSDPTTIPVTALTVPTAAMLVTAYLCVYQAGASHRSG